MLPHLLSLASLLLGASATSCKTSPSDASWPTTAQWSSLNSTVSGRLLSTIPIASVCHHGPLGSYNSTACAALQAAWSSAWTHQSHPSSIMSPLFTNRTCLPSTPSTGAEGECTLGYYPAYVLNVSSVADVQAGVNFARAHDLRLVVKNTGHDFFGKSTGRDALSLWTHWLRSIEFESYSGVPAVRVGAGVSTVSVYEAAAAVGRVVVGGEQPSVGFAGGYVAGGGHSPLTSRYGMAADQVLEMTVVTADGVVRRCARDENGELFWALRGGGGGVFAVVVEVVVKTHADGMVTTMPLQFATEDTEAFWAAVRQFFALTPRLGALGVYSYNNIMPGSFSSTPVLAPNMSAAGLYTELAPLYATLREHNITYSANATEYPRFLDAWRNSFPTEVAGIMSGSVSRLVPTAVLTNSTTLDTFMDAYRAATDELYYFAVFGISPPPGSEGEQGNAVNPAWRRAGMHILAGYLIPENSTEHQVVKQRDWANEVFQPVRDATKGAGCYQSEAALTEPDWQTAFHGTNYERLLQVKHTWDPTGLFYATKGVGSEEWEVEDGRLCQV
ncbi:FAD binding domain-containing protein [Tricharina praecox]|uniref:FAD binding domain-containing protein n=1 Tax=Tricharina praecox TaxID=43433 RepID=UPI0022206E3B|nr:FAD binding domain-containing protein [Tricharina praecox]KAI5840912.1 FAD binding domain-containing protein [Tricharina praecox]